MIELEEVFKIAEVLKNVNESSFCALKACGKIKKLSKGEQLFMDADMLGSKKETVSRHLKLLTEKKLVIVKRNEFIIPERDKLMKYFKQP